MTAKRSDPSLAKLQHIEGLISQGKLQEAAKSLNAAIEADPSDARIFLLGSRLAEFAGNAKGALETAQKATKLAPNWGRGLVELAGLNLRQGDPAQAVKNATQAVDKEPNDLIVVSLAADVAQGAGEMMQALEWLVLASKLTPKNIEFKHLIAKNQMLVGDPSAALSTFSEILAETPRDKRALLGRIQAAMDLRDLTSAMADSEALLSIEPENQVAKFWGELASGVVPKTLPEDLVTDLYRDFAPNFDRYVVKMLGYQLPRQVAEMILQRYPDRQLNLLDLGCGTGLLGACLGKIRGAMVGVDVSDAMLDQAQRHGVYDKFHRVNLVDALAETPNALYDVITACDVFLYVGDLADCIFNAHRVLRSNGHLIFSCEATSNEEDQMALRPGPRFAHAKAHVELLCRNSGFDAVDVSDVVLRTERGQPVIGFVVVARKAN